MKVFIFTVWLLMTACNVNQVLVTSDQEESISGLLDQAKYEYDKGNYDEALSLAETAYDKNPAYESSSILLGYIYLSRAGLDIFSLSKGIIAEKDSNDTNKTTSLFTSLANIIGIDQTELSYLTQDDTSQVANIDIYLPLLATEARDSESLVIENLNTAISYFCPFVDADARLETDSRHSEESCPPSTLPLKKAGQSDFGLALAHLGEAVAFYSVLFYTDDGETIPNLQRSVKALESRTSDVAAYSSDIATLSLAVDNIFPTSGDDESNSMLNAMFDNLQTTNNALGAAGVPDDISAAIGNVIEDLQEGTNNGIKNTQKLKAKLTKKLSEDLSNQVESIEATDEELAEICENLDTISDLSLPDNCP